MTTAFLFPGQGTVFARMGKDLYEHWTAVRELYELATEVTGIDLATLSFEAPRQRLIETDNAHLLVFVHSLAVATILRQAGFQPDYLSGHSLGQLTAVTTAGALGLEDGLRLVARRGTLLADCCRQHPGTMMAVRRRSLDELRAFLDTWGEGELALAAVNGRQEITLAGEATVLKKAMRRLRAEGAATSMLGVSGAFHSRRVAPAARAFTSLLAEVDFADPMPPVVSTASGGLLRTGREIRRDLEDHMLRPVRWDRVLETLDQHGVDRWIEVGPGKTLTGLVRHWNRQARAFFTSTRAAVEALCAAAAGSSARTGELIHG